jgi:hypothetical protein
MTLTFCNFHVGFPCNLQYAFSAVFCLLKNNGCASQWLLQVFRMKFVCLRRARQRWLVYSLVISEPFVMSFTTVVLLLHRPGYGLTIDLKHLSGKFNMVKGTPASPQFHRTQNIWVSIMARNLYIQKKVGPHSTLWGIHVTSLPNLAESNGSDHCVYYKFQIKFESDYEW